MLNEGFPNHNYSKIVNIIGENYSFLFSNLFETTALNASSVILFPLVGKIISMDLFFKNSILFRVVKVPLFSN